MFAPPFGPADFMGSASGINDSALFRGTECPTKPCQRGFDEPRFEGDSRSLATGIEFRGHSQRLQCGCDAPGRHTHHYDGGNMRLACALPFPGLINHSQAFTRCGPVAFERAFPELQQKGLGRRDMALGAAFADFHHLA